MRLGLVYLIGVLCICSSVEAWCKMKMIRSKVALWTLVVGLGTPAVHAVDCFKDCSKNCLKVAPGSAEYCKESCTDYCAQDDRTDGLSGSVSNTGGETGIFGGSPIEGGNSVTREADRPPALPKLIPDSMLKIPKVKST